MIKLLYNVIEPKKFRLDGIDFENIHGTRECVLQLCCNSAFSCKTQ